MINVRDKLIDKIQELKSQNIEPERIVLSSVAYAALKENLSKYVDSENPGFIEEFHGVPIEHFPQDEMEKPFYIVSSEVGVIKRKHKADFQIVEADLK